MFELRNEHTGLAIKVGSKGVYQFIPGTETKYINHLKYLSKQIIVNVDSEVARRLRNGEHHPTPQRASSRPMKPAR